jgi:hypothetical protein
MRRSGIPKAQKKKSEVWSGGIELQNIGGCIIKGGGG